MIGIAFCGPAGCGKTTLSKYLEENYGFKRFSFAAGVKKIATEYFGMVGKDRNLLQAVGHTMRQIDPEIWIRYTANALDGHQFVVIDDLRYPNEYEALKRMGFIIVKLTGRAMPLTSTQKSHPSEQHYIMMQEDFLIDTSGDVSESFDQLERVLANAFIAEMHLDMRYFEKVSEINKENKNYLRGRNFEYRVMRVLRNHGFHVMRKFGSKDDIWALPSGEKLNVSVDVTAYKDGVYLIVSCKYSIKGPTSWIVDTKWRNLRDYALKYGAIPIFAGVDEDRHVYFVDLRTLKPIELGALVGNATLSLETDETPMQKLIERAWAMLDMMDKEYKAAETPAQRAKWAGEMVRLFNTLSKLLQRAGETGTKQDLTNLFERAKEILSEESKDE